MTVLQLLCGTGYTEVPTSSGCGAPGKTQKSLSVLPGPGGDRGNTGLIYFIYLTRLNFPTGPVPMVEATHQGHRELSCPLLFSEALSQLLMLNVIRLFTIIMNGCVAKVSTWLRIYKRAPTLQTCCVFQGQMHQRNSLK